jgi:hypothetical protein
MFQDMKQRRFNNDMALRQDARLQAQADREADTAARAGDTRRANESFTYFDQLDLLTEDKTAIDLDKFRARAKEDPGFMDEVNNNLARGSGFVDASVESLTTDQLPDGSFVLRANNADGSTGVITEDGSSNPDSKPAVFGSYEDLVNHINATFTYKIAPNQTVMNLRNLSDQIDYFDKIQAIAANVNQLPLAAQRGAINVVAGLGGQDLVEANNELATVTGGPTISAAPTTTEPEPEAEPEKKPRTAGGIRRAARDKQAARRRERVEEKLTQLRGRKKEGYRGRNATSNRQSIDRQIEDLETELADINKRLGDRDGEKTIKLDLNWGPDAFPVVEEVGGKLEEKSAGEIQNAVESGEVQVTPQLVSQTRVAMQEAGVKKLSDLQKMNRRDAAVAAAVLIASSDNASERMSLRQGIENIFETGTTSFSAKDLDSARRQNQNAATQAYSAYTSRLTELRAQKDDLTGDAADAREYAATIYENNILSPEVGFYNQDGEFVGDERAIRIFATKIPQMLQRRGKYTTQAGRDAVSSAINDGLSASIAAYANDGDSSILQTVMSFFRSDANGQVGDFDLARVKVNDPKNPTELFYLSESVGSDGSREQQGASITIRDLEKVNKRLADAVVNAAVKNTSNVR